MPDLYTTFLEIPDGPRPPKAHVLLGVEPDVNDPEVIEAGAQRQMDALDNYALSSDRATREQVQQLMNEIARARVELVKRAEARKKKAKPAETPKPEPAPTPVMQNPAPAPPTTPQAPEPKTKRDWVGLRFALPKLSAEAWSLLAMAWLISLVITGIGAYFFASQQTPAVELAGGDASQVDRNNAVTERPGPGTEPKPVKTDLLASSIDEVMKIKGRDQRLQAFLALRAGYEDDFETQSELVRLALIAFNDLAPGDLRLYPLTPDKAYRSMIVRGGKDPQGPPLTDISPLTDLRLDSLILRDLPEVNDFSPLATVRTTFLRLFRCEGFKDISLLNEIEGLSLVAVEWTSVSDLRPLRLKSLRYLSLTGSKQITSLEGLEGMSIEHLVFNHNPDLVDISALRHVTGTKRLYFSHANFFDLRPIQHMELTALQVKGCRNVSSLSALDEMSSLKVLSLDTISGVTSNEKDRLKRRHPELIVNESLSYQSRLPRFEPMSRLAEAEPVNPPPSQILTWEEVKQIKDRDRRLAEFLRLRDSKDNFKEKAELIRLALGTFNGIENVETIVSNYGVGRDRLSITVENPADATEPNLAITDLSPLTGLSADGLALRNLVNVRDIKPLRTANLRYIYMRGCTGVDDWSVFGSIIGLEDLDIGQTGIDDLNKLSIKRLKTLSMQACPNLTSLDGLQGKTIEVINVRDNPQLNNVDALGQVRGLRVVNLLHCGVRSVDTLAGHHTLVELNLGYCLQLTSITPLEQISTLKEAVLPPVGGLINSDEVFSLQGKNPGLVLKHMPHRLPPRRIELDDRSLAKAYAELNEITSEAERHTTFIKLRDTLVPFSNGQVDLIRKELKRVNGADVQLIVTKPRAGEYHLSVGQTPYRRGGPNDLVRNLSPLAGLTASHLSMCYLPDLTDFSFLKGSSIQRLDLTGCSAFSDVGILNEVKGLDELTLDQTAVWDLEPLGIKTLKTLSLEHCKKLRTLDGLDNMHIKALSVMGSSSLVDIDALQRVRGLTQLNLSETGVQYISPIIGQENLDHLDLSGCGDLRSIEQLQLLANLKTLTLTGLQRVPDWEFARVKQALPNTQITDGEPSGVVAVDDPAPPVEAPDPIEPPKPANQPEPEDVEPILTFNQIKQIRGTITRKNEFIKLRDSLKPYSSQQGKLIRDALRAFNEAPRLSIAIIPNKDKSAFILKTNVDIENRNQLANGQQLRVRDISMLQGLAFETLDLRGFTGLSDFSVLSTMRIEELNLNYCLRLKDFDDINKIEGLESLDISNTSIESLEGLTIDKLDTLTMKTCRELTSLDGLEGKTIRYLQASENMRITDYDALSEIRGLKWLDLNTTAIVFSTPLRGLELERLDVSNCRYLTELAGLIEMKSLKILDVKESSSIQEGYTEALRSRIDGLKIAE